MKKRRRKTKRMAAFGYSNQRKRRQIASGVSSILKFLAVLFFIALIAFLLLRFAIPPIMQIVGIDWPPTSAPPATSTPTPAPTPHPINALSPTQIQTDIDLVEGDIRYAANPTRFKNNIYFSGGKDDKGGPQNKDIYKYDMFSRKKEKLGNIVRKNSDIFQVQVNEDWIVYLDHKREGGGFIRALSIKDNKNFEIKPYYIGKIDIKLQGNLLCWTERTGSYMDKVFLYNLSTGENITIATLERTVFGQSDADVSESRIIWAGPNPALENPNSETADGIVYSFSLNPSSTDKQIQSYSPGVYVHDPKIKGNIMIWADGNHGISPNLYMSRNNAAPEKIAEGVTGYGLGSNFIVYCKDQEIRALMLGEASFDKKLSLEGEKCIFGGVSSDTIFYYVTGGISKNDIIKYIPVNDLKAGLSLEQSMNLDSSKQSEKGS